MRSAPSDAEVAATLRDLVGRLRANRLTVTPGTFMVFHGDVLLDVLDAVLSGRRPAGLSPEQGRDFRLAATPLTVVSMGIGWPDDPGSPACPGCCPESPPQ